MYIELWKPVVGELLDCERESINLIRLLQCSSKKKIIIGHLTRKVSKPFTSLNYERHISSPFLCPTWCVHIEINA